MMLVLHVCSGESFQLAQVIETQTWNLSSRAIARDLQFFVLHGRAELQIPRYRSG